MTKIISTAFAMLFMLALHAQQTGSFTVNVDFDEADYQFNRDLYFYVPENYDATQSYPLVVGFRGGPNTNAGQFRDQIMALGEQLGAIIMCPENIAHFNNQEGLVKQLFKYSVAETTSLYNIDMEKIYLTGLSFGGRHAVIVAMDTDAGEIPALRGVIPFATGANGDAQPNYDAVAQFAPACVCIGLSDSHANGAEVLHNQISGVGHTVDFATYPDEMMECIDFIESTYMTIGTDDLIIEADLLTIHPNPATDMVQITLKNDAIPKSYRIHTLEGKELRAKTVFDTQINVSALENGTYLLLFDVNDGIVVKQLMVQR